ncbi:MAG: YlbF family regulator [Firmicutes bacterium]|nr:YlbF family regulator [Bacillota bacterium]
MTAVEEKTRELGELIQSSEEMKKYKAAELRQNNDEEAAHLMREFNVARINLAKDMQNGKIERADAVKKNNEAFDALLEKSDIIREYVEAKKEFDTMIQRMNQMLNFYITGQDPNCTHDCSTCGGCG